MTNQRMNQFYKTKICPWFFKGRCERGQTCRFAHSNDELRILPDLERTSLCPQVAKAGQCLLENCRFAHSMDELRATDDMYKTALCFMWMRGCCEAGGLCRHAHGIQELRGKETRHHSSTSLNCHDNCVPASSSPTEHLIQHTRATGNTHSLIVSNNPALSSNSLHSSHLNRFGINKDDEYTCSTDPPASAASPLTSHPLDDDRDQVSPDVKLMWSQKISHSSHSPHARDSPDRSTSFISPTSTSTATSPSKVRDVQESKVKRMSDMRGSIELEDMREMSEGKGTREMRQMTETANGRTSINPAYLGQIRVDTHESRHHPGHLNQSEYGHVSSPHHCRQAPRQHTYPLQTGLSPPHSHPSTQLPHPHDSSQPHLHFLNAHQHHQDRLPASHTTHSPHPPLSSMSHHSPHPPYSQIRHSPRSPLSQVPSPIHVNRDFTAQCVFDPPHSPSRSTQPSPCNSAHHTSRHTPHSLPPSPQSNLSPQHQRHSSHHPAHSPHHQRQSSHHRIYSYSPNYTPHSSCDEDRQSLTRRQNQRIKSRRESTHSNTSQILTPSAHSTATSTEQLTALFHNVFQ
eukprot:GHVN01005783.1.p1 GENE.GHVN01005783.1~~GHVN01005783.1.p1  ORF type:complete len:572 (-),score=169.88 GHVN01005783.1:59-1774(-)